MAKEKILVVDDEKNIVELLKYNLEKEGYETWTSEWLPVPPPSAAYAATGSAVRFPLRRRACCSRSGTARCHGIRRSSCWAR